MEVQIHLVCLIVIRKVEVVVRLHPVLQTTVAVIKIIKP